MIVLLRSAVAFVLATLLAVAGAGAELSPELWTEIETLESGGDPAAALARLQAAVRTGAGGDELRVAATLQRLFHRLGRLSDAQGAGGRWIALAEAEGDTAELATALWRTGRSFAAQDRDREAAELLARALELRSRGGDPLAAAEVRVDLATVRARLGEYRDAESLLDAAERSPEVAADPRVAIKVLTAWGSLLGSAGDTLGALDRHERAHGRALELADRATLAMTASNLAQSLLAGHDYARALVYLEEALAQEPRERTRAVILVTAGICHFELNQLEAAAAALREAKEVATSVGNVAIAGWADGELGQVLLGRGDDEGALASFDRAIDSCRATGDRRNEAVWWINKGRVRRDQERWREALDFYRRAEAIQRAIPGQLVHANLRKQQGQCHAGLGDLATAERLFLEALELARGQGDSKVAWETERELARLYRRLGRTDEAIRSALAALDGIETIRSALQIEAFETDFFEDKIGAYAEAIDLLLEGAGEDGPARAFEAAERARARAFLGSLAEARGRLDETLPPELVERERGLLLEISQLQRTIRRGDSATAAAELEARERELETLQLRVRSEHPRFAEMRGLAPTRLEAVQGALGPGEVLVAYLLAEPVSHLWMVDRQSVRHHPLPPGPELEALARHAYGSLLDPGAPPRLEAIAEALLAPLHELETAPSSLRIVPWGILHYLPFEALPYGGERLVDWAPTSYAPSASALVELRGRTIATAAPRCLAVGDANYGGAATAARGLGWTGWDTLGELPYTRREVERVRSRFGVGSTRALLGAEATESRLKAEDLATYSVLHLATHGWIDASSPARSGLVLGVDSGVDDGILQFREILRLPLAAELVTLSACESALGELVTGEGMVGLARAFFYAGSETVVASLWSVSDEASAALMDSFYDGLAAGLPKAEALRRARLAVRATPGYEHPYYWAPFVLLGRGEDGVAMPPPSRAVWIAGGIAVLLLLGLIARRARRRRGDSGLRGSSR